MTEVPRRANEGLWNIRSPPIGFAISMRCQALPRWRFSCLPPQRASLEACSGCETQGLKVLSEAFGLAVVKFRLCPIQWDR